MAEYENSFVADVADAIGDILSFLGIGGDEAAEAVESVAEEAQIEAFCLEQFEIGLSAMVNEGQLVLMEQVGPDAYVAAGQYALENDGDCSGFLVDQTDHPDAIGETLEAAEDEISAYVSELLEN